MSKSIFIEHIGEYSDSLHVLLLWNSQVASMLLAEGLRLPPTLVVSKDTETTKFIAYPV